MGKIVAMTGNEAVGTAMSQINPDVVAAFPITPQTELMHRFADSLADGLVDTELVLVESEHSAMSACVGSAASGARTMTATSSQGLALMWEILYVAAGLRLPIAMAVVNRSLSAPINIHCDHSDTLGARDSGWIQIYCENSQEAYDSIIQAVPIAEAAGLPTMVCYDGFIISHTTERVEMLEDDEVREFIGTRKPERSFLDYRNPVSYGPLALTDYFFEHKVQVADAMMAAKTKINEIQDKFARLSGRKYDLFESYRLDDAEFVVVVMNSAAGTAKDAVDELRAKGEPVGLIRPRIFRPMPVVELREALKSRKGIAVLDRAFSLGAEGGPVYMEIRSLLYGLKEPPAMLDFIYGLGGRNVSVDQILTAFDRIMSVVRDKKEMAPVGYLGLRE